MCPYGGRLMDGVTPGLGASHLVCHCLLIESKNELILVDTGFGSQDILHPRKRLSPFFRFVDRPQLDFEQTAIHQIQKLGFHAADVRHIVLTHLDFDHAGGISDFPHAQVHVFEKEYQSALSKKGFIHSKRYRKDQWTNHEAWTRYHAGGEQWFGFDAVRDLKGLPPEILMVPLVGHTWGHCGVAVWAEQNWMLLAGDAYFNGQEMSLDNPYSPIGAAAYQALMEVDRKSRLENQHRLRDLIRAHSDEVLVSCSHDPAELEMFQRGEHLLFEHNHNLFQSGGEPLIQSGGEPPVTSL